MRRSVSPAGPSGRVLGVRVRRAAPGTQDGEQGPRGAGGGSQTGPPPQMFVEGGSLPLGAEGRPAVAGFAGGHSVRCWGCRRLARVGRAASRGRAGKMERW